MKRRRLLIVEENTKNRAAIEERGAKSREDALRRVTQEQEAQAVVAEESEVSSENLE